MGTYQIEWKKSALRELKRLDRKAVPRIITAVDALASAPLPSGATKLQGSLHTYRIRIGTYRVIYELFQSRLVVEIVRVRHRKDAYRG